MTPEYIEQLAGLADPGKLWLKSPFEELTAAQVHQRDTGIALRRYASHVRRVRELLGTERSLCITPLSRNSVRTETVPTPALQDFRSSDLL